MHRDMRIAAARPLQFYGGPNYYAGSEAKNGWSKLREKWLDEAIRSEAGSRANK